MKVSTAGNAGDIILLCSILAQLPDGPHDLFLRTSPVTSVKTHEDALHMHGLLAPLIARLPYINSFLASDAPVEWESEGFRGGGIHFRNGLSIVEAYLAHLGRSMDFDRSAPWLRVATGGTVLGNGRVCINRTLRYNNPHFPWRKIVEFYSPKLLFIGGDEEYEEFCAEFGQVERHGVRDYLEVAQIIAGSDLFIGNQSSANALCEGLKHSLIQETCLWIPDCIYIRPSAQHVGDGSCVLRDGNSFLHLEASTFECSLGDVLIPPGNWQYPGQVSEKILFTLVQKVMVSESIDNEAAFRKIEQFNRKRVPGFFPSPIQPDLRAYNLALSNAKKHENRNPDQR